MYIHYFTPYATDGNIGQAYNQACSLVPNPDGWIVIRDGDTMLLTPDWGKHVEQTLQLHGDTYALFGAVTNRVRDMHHKVPLMFDEMDLRTHYKVAHTLENSKYTEVKQTISDIAGFFMAFKKSTWEKVGGFDENTPVFDRMFSDKVRATGGKLAVMQGLYVLHAYRLWSADPEIDVKHLPNV